MKKYQISTTEDGFVVIKEPEERGTVILFDSKKVISMTLERRQHSTFMDIRILTGQTTLMVPAGDHDRIANDILDKISNAIIESKKKEYQMIKKIMSS